MKLTMMAAVLFGLAGLATVSGSLARAEDPTTPKPAGAQDFKAFQQEARDTAQQVKQEAVKAEATAAQKVKQTVADKKAKIKARSSKGDTMKQRKAKLKKAAQDKTAAGTQKAGQEIQKAEGKANDAVNKALGQ